MGAITILAVLAGLCVAWHIVATILVYDYLRRHGEQVSFIWLRVKSPWYASRYQEITKTETGRVGPLFYHWVISINLTAVLGLLAIAVHYF